MSKTGRMMYVPPVIIEQLDTIMREENLPFKSEAFRKLGYYAKIGKKVKTNVTFENIVPRIPIGDTINRKENIIRPKRQDIKDILGI